jgi:predicted  nucleic acid-binding Zn-ribbon protein
MSSLEKERDANSVQATSAEAKYFFSRDEVKLRDNFITEFQKQNLETETKLKKQQSMYETVRSDRNMVSKNLAEKEEERKEQQKRYVRVIHQISQLKEEIDTKETELVKEHNEHKKKDKKIEDEEERIKKYETEITDKIQTIRLKEN